MHSIIETQLLIALSLTGVDGASEKQDSAPIELVGTGVAKSYSASKMIRCEEYDWRVKWKSTQDSNRITGEVIVLIKERGALLTEASEAIFSRFSNINSVSATCNLANERTLSIDVEVAF